MLSQLCALEIIFAGKGFIVCNYAHFTTAITILLYRLKEDFYFQVFSAFSCQCCCTQLSIKTVVVSSFKISQTDRDREWRNVIWDDCCGSWRLHGSKAVEQDPALTTGSRATDVHSAPLSSLWTPYLTSLAAAAAAVAVAAEGFHGRRVKWLVAISVCELSLTR